MEGECTVCRNILKIIRLPCGHLICESCLYIKYTVHLDKETPMVCLIKSDVGTCNTTISSQFVEQSPVYNSNKLEEYLARQFLKKIRYGTCPEVIETNTFEFQITQRNSSVQIM